MFKLTIPSGETESRRVRVAQSSLVVLFVRVDLRVVLRAMNRAVLVVGRRVHRVELHRTLAFGDEVVFHPGRHDDNAARFDLAAFAVKHCIAFALDEGQNLVNAFVRFLADVLARRDAHHDQM